MEERIEDIVREMYKENGNWEKQTIKQTQSFKDVDLSGANFVGADLEGSDFTNAIIKNNTNLSTFSTSKKLYYYE